MPRVDPLLVKNPNGHDGRRDLGKNTLRIFSRGFGKGSGG